uniref:Uncharacterized protein n=1 Tax=Steinernema glaseri TaxID=37863 RepID=A0A1I7ZPM8_9BILA
MLSVSSESAFLGKSAGLVVTLASSLSGRNGATASESQAKQRKKYFKQLMNTKTVLMRWFTIDQQLQKQSIPIRPQTVEFSIDS